MHCAGLPHQSALRRAIAHLFLFAALTGLAERARAQSPTTATIEGRITDENGRGLSGVDVAVISASTGATMRGVSKAEGRYVVGGLDIGGPYEVVARRLGARRLAKSGFYLSLGQRLRVDLQLAQQPVVLEGIQSNAASLGVFSRAHQGSATLLSDSLIHQMPVINRDVYDLVRLVPQMSTWYAMTASGANPRVNSIRVDGIGDQVAASNLAAGQLYGAKVIPLDAVKEYQVALSPYDVRQGGFAGASVNVVTRSGTNDFHGSVLGFTTNEGLGRNAPFVRRVPYEKQQLAFSLGGPIVRDRLHFFVASELQRRQIPALGPSLGTTDGAQLPVRTEDIGRFQQLLAARGLNAGSGGAIANANPSSSLFLRVDAMIPRWNSRLIVRGNYGEGDSSIFARPTLLAPTNCPSTQCFPLSSLQHARWVVKRSAAVQLVTNFAGGAYNELLLGGSDVVSGFRPAVKQPLVLVTVPGTSGAPAVLQAGTHEIATGQRTANWSAELTDNLTIPVGAHRMTLGFSSQLFALDAFQLRGAYGIWEFASLDSLQRGVASRYRVTRDTGSVTAADGANHAIYFADEWSASSRLSITFGVRADIPVLSAHPPYVSEVASTLGFRTDRIPSTRVSWSPRAGFNYDLTDAANTPMQLRGGAGLFTGRAPLFWLFGGFSAYGLAARTLQCGSLSSDAGAPPPFVADYDAPPLACAGGQTFGASQSSEVDVLAPNLRSPQVLRASLAVDRQLPFKFVGTVEALVTRSTEALFYSGVNLREPVGVDRHGRVMYGAISSTGVASPRRSVSGIGDIISVTNQSRDYAYNITGELRRTSGLADLSASLSVGRTRDVQSPRPLSALLIDNWRFARPVVGRQDDMQLGISDYDQPLRAQLSGVLHSPWKRLRTDLAILYVGGSGFPFTYVAGGAQGRGDLNADGAIGNDPIYIPRSSFDTSEITFGGSPAEVAAQQAAFDRFVNGARCLREQRARIMSRNSCRSPWTNLAHVAVRQSVPVIASHSIGLDVQVFNVLNLLNPRWGRVQLPGGAAPTSTNQLPILSQIGTTAEPNGQPIYRFDVATQRYQSENVDSYYQLQLAVRYTF